MHGAFPVKAVESLTVLATASDDSCSSRASVNRSFGGKNGEQVNLSVVGASVAPEVKRTRLGHLWRSPQIQEWKPLKGPAWGSSADT